MVLYHHHAHFVKSFVFIYNISVICNISETVAANFMLLYKVYIINISKRSLYIANVAMSQCMNACTLADKEHKQEMPYACMHTVICTP